MSSHAHDHLRPRLGPLAIRRADRRAESWSVSAPGVTLRGLFDAVFGEFPTLRGYVLDERGALRHHIVVFIDGEPLRDKEQLNVAVNPDSEIHVLQALSGG